MHIDNLPSVLVGLAGTAVGSFVLAVILDDALGVLAALRAGNFAWAKLPSFLESQFGTKQALALLGLIVAAYVAGGDVRSAALAALTAGGGALTLSVLRDVYAKILAIAMPSAPTPASPAVAAPASK